MWGWEELWSTSRLDEATKILQHISGLKKYLSCSEINIQILGEEHPKRYCLLFCTVQMRSVLLLGTVRIG